jgi:hypothetical protein
MAFQKNARSDQIQAQSNDRARTNRSLCRAGANLPYSTELVAENVAGLQRA